MRIFLPYEDEIKFKIRKPNGMTIQQLSISLSQPDEINRTNLHHVHHPS